MRTARALGAAAGLVMAAAHGQEIEDWNAKFQSTYIWQTKPALRSPYQGEHSLIGAHEKSYSFTATTALGLRLGRQTEVYFNPEVAQGVPLSGLQGLAGFSNGEMARTSGSNLSLYRARLFVRHVIPIGEDSEIVESATNQLGSRYAKQRLTLTLGNVSLLDLFDANAYAHDPRLQFMNWALMTHAAYDFAADARGYTTGFAAEYKGAGWALRGGRFLQPKLPNQLPLDERIGSHYGDQIELEWPYALATDRPGVLRLLGWRGRAVMARYDDALAAARGGKPSLDAVRSSAQIKSGVGLNLEQALTPALGVFARAMRADGRTETYAFTEADRSVSAGVSARGAAWGRADDALGVAVATHSLSGLHRRFLEAGGLSFFLGDGRLSYAPEQIFEAYYAWTPVKGLTLSFDYQRVRNPGYNADRGPASFVALRLHLEV